jgi:hypothetical protein
VTNACFLPILYFLYPETGQLHHIILRELLLTHFTANRSLEDIDAYYRSNPSLIVTKDPDAICRARPQKYIEHEDEEVRRTAKDKAMGQPVEAEHVEFTGETTE